MLVKVERHELRLSNLDKVFWPQEGYSKGDLINYFVQVAPYLLPHLQDRPLTIVRYPDGIKGESFYQKDLPRYAPEWLIRAEIRQSEGRVIHYAVCNDLDSLVWLVNLGAIEFHPWLSRRQEDDRPDLMVLDLDPPGKDGFSQTLTLALALREELGRYKLRAYPKTSGATGLHLYVPIRPSYPYRDVTQAAGYVARRVAEAFPGQATVERMIAKRGGRVYLDYLQNGRGKTLISVYGPRPRPGAPVSMPLTWEEVEAGRIRPEDFHIQNAPELIRERGELFAPVLEAAQDLQPLLQAVQARGAF